MYHIGICDDGINICSSLENMILQWGREKNVQTDINIWYTGEKLEEWLKEENQLDILFLDIELLSMTGMEVADYIRNRLDNMELQIIYISGKASYAQGLFRTQPLDFLVKPISQSRIDEALELAVRVMKKKSVRFTFQQGKDYYYIPLGDIVYLESTGRKVKIVTRKNIFEFYGRLKEAAGQLSEDFIVIHQSYIVNREFIFRYTYEMVELADGKILTISRAHRKRVRERILREE